MHHHSYHKYHKNRRHTSLKGTLQGMIAGAIWGTIGLAAGIVVFASPSQFSSASIANDINKSSAVPASVTTAAQSIIALQRVKYDLPAGVASEASARSVANGLNASGVVIDGDTVLTAGHAVDDDGRLACSRTSIDVAGTDAAHTASRHIARLGNAKHANGQDIAVLKVDPDQQLSELPKLRLAGAKPKKGEIVYFVNYQPTADGRVRSPGTGQNGPAIFRGVIVGYNQNGYSIATNIDGHAATTTDSILRKGGSGGAVLNAKGQLVALSVSIDSVAPERTAKSVANSYGVRLPNGSYQLTKAQLVDRSTIANLQSSLIRCN